MTYRAEKYGRILADCAVEGRVLGEAQMQAGLALAYRRYSDLCRCPKDLQTHPHRSLGQ
ncbi:hypothetical protein ATDW_03550 [Asticcacaulis sp. DW145]|uniref:hypothetical protein n=1 Tax=Asticcacaulis sp. DW145 TaxID=3095608 RepID=UPI00308D509F|nr:hypothetical protein ATDW_03550 [Asticcacaulis sp. DW145]